MALTRREFLRSATAAFAVGATAAGCERTQPEDLAQPEPSVPSPVMLNGDVWDEVRAQFALSPDYIHMSALYVASHPKVVRDAIDIYRKELDNDPVMYLNRHNRRRIGHVLTSAAAYLGVDEPSDIALTDSTTMGLGLVYNGLRLETGSDVLTTTREYYATDESLRLAALRKQISVRRVSMYDDIHHASEESLTRALINSIRPATRVIALTWVHSGTGLKLPMQQICNAVRQINNGREEKDQILVCVDGVHGFGVEDVTMPDLGCDFFIAGCHKWLFGPRGTGLIWGSPRAWRNVVPTVPSFYDDGTREAWITGTDVSGRTTGRRMSPGGFKPFEHQWAIAEALAFHQAIGKSRVAARTHELARQLKEGLAKMKHVTLRTPMSSNLSSGIVCFDVRRMNPFAVVNRLQRRRVVATVTPYSVRHVRFAPSIRNSPEEVDAVLREVHALR